jgi:hypothetical protein
VTYDYGEYSTVSFSDLSLPSGAQLVSAQLFVRCAKNGTGPGGLYAALVADTPTFSTGSVTWESPQEMGSAFQFGGLTDAGLDAAAATWTCVSLSQVIVYEASVRVLYLEKPIATVTSPSGTITTNLATVNWGGSFDVHSTSSPAYSDVKVFSAAQYGAGGFDPSTSAAVCSSGVEYGAATSRAFDERLEDGAYRAYVRIAPGSAASLWSDWDYEAFTVAASLPGEPSVTLTGEADDGRVRIDVECGADTDSVQVQRDSGDGFVNVRTADGEGSVAFTDEGTLYDYEAPNGVTCTYRVRAYDESNATYSDWVEDTVSWSSDDAWLKCVGDPSLNVSLVPRSYESFDVPANQGVFRVLGSSTATVVSDVPGPESGQVTFMTSSDEDREALSDLLASGSPILLQVNGHPDRLVSLGDRNSTRLVDKGWIEDHDDTLGWTLVGEDGWVVGVGSWAYPDAVPVTGLALLLPLGATAGLTDLSGNSRNGTAVGGLTAGGVATGPLVWEDNGATDFDGTDDRVATTYATRQNLVRNPSFEVGTTAWAATGVGITLSRVTSEFQDGNASLQIVNVGTAARGAQTEAITVLPSTQYAASIRVKAPVGALVSFAITPYLADGATVSGSATQVSHTGTGDWVLLTAAITTGASAVRLRVSTRTQGATALTWHADSVLLEQASSAGTFFPTAAQLASGEAGWTGTAHASASNIGCFANGTARTFMGWAYRDTASGNPALIGGSNNGINGIFFRLLSGSNDVQFFPNDSVGASTWTNAWPGTGEWVHWALVFIQGGGSNNTELYINGVSQGPKTQAASYPTGSTLEIGSWAAGNVFDGKMAWVSVHERALTATEILTAYNAGQGIATLGPYLT